MPVAKIKCPNCNWSPYGAAPEPGNHFGGPNCVAAPPPIFQNRKSAAFSIILQTVRVHCCMALSHHVQHVCSFWRWLVIHTDVIRPPPHTIPQVPPPSVLSYYWDVGATFCLHTQIVFNFADTYGMQPLHGPNVVVLSKYVYIHSCRFEKLKGFHSQTLYCFVEYKLFHYHLLSFCGKEQLFYFKISGCFTKLLLFQQHVSCFFVKREVFQ